MTNVASPLRYPGGKGRIYQFVSELIAENNLIGCKYIEPYAGGAGLALRLLYEEYAESIVINDLDPLVYCFWKECTSKPERMIEWIEKTPVTIKTWKKSKQILNNVKNSKSFELATAFFFLNRTNVSGVINGGMIGGFGQEGRYKIDARFNKKELIKKIEKIGRFSNRIEVKNLDGIKLVSKINKSSSLSLVYVDPPYFVKGSDLYLNSYNKEDHIKLSNCLHKLSIPWLLSYDNESFITNLYPKFRKRAYKLQHSASNKIGDEVLIFSPIIKFNRSLNYLREVRVI